MIMKIFILKMKQTDSQDDNLVYDSSELEKESMEEEDEDQKLIILHLNFAIKKLFYPYFQINISNHNIFIEMYSKLFDDLMNSNR